MSKRGESRGRIAQLDREQLDSIRPRRAYRYPSWNQLPRAPRAKHFKLPVQHVVGVVLLPSRDVLIPITYRHGLPEGAAQLYPWVGDIFHFNIERLNVRIVVWLIEVDPTSREISVPNGRADQQLLPASIISYRTKPTVVDVGSKDARTKSKRVVQTWRNQRVKWIIGDSVSIGVQQLMPFNVDFEKVHSPPELTRYRCTNGKQPLAMR
ncbi:MAG: hypothetical protein ACI9VR_002965 [Cognaticolwellia sp.]|jgi:hypothetical protein